MRNSKKKVFHSLLSLMLCASMLIGTTFAWFTDSVTNTGNVIKSGKLDLEMYWTEDLNSDDWHNVEDDLYNTIFNYDNWEPGYTEVRYIKIVNNGNLALNYELTLTPVGSVGKLAEVINVYCANEGIEIKSREDLSNLSAIGLLDNIMNGGSTVNGTLLAAEQESPFHKSGETIVTLAMSMITTAGNDYQDESIGDGFSITALATQCPYEEDSLGNDYDANAEYPNVLVEKEVSATVTPVDGKVPQGGLTIQGGGIKADVPEGVLLEEGVDTLTIKITPLDKSASGITTVNDEILIPVDVHVEGVSEDNTVPIIIELGEVLPKGLNMGNYKLVHVEDDGNADMTYEVNAEDLDSHNEFTYDPMTGAVTVAMATFSEVALVADTDNAWEGNFDYSWYSKVARTSDYNIANADQLAAFGAIVGGMNGQTQDSFTGKTVKLLSNINLGDDEGSNNQNLIFYPIGYYNSTDSYVKKSDESVTSGVSSFEGIFDGNGHTISNFYQNTWEMFGDYNDGYSGTPNYYKDAMGLFGCVSGGIIKNLTVNNFSSDGEYTPTGVIAAYADGDATFENIAITNCNPRVYNTGNGGIIGIAGRENEAVESISLKNITVDNSNKISALWGSYDVACGGLVGMYRGNADGNGNATGDTISFNNCHVAAQMDVYNDVCGNYQYYAYRYAGMIIGSVRHNTTNTEGRTIPNMAGISAADCTVNYGNWNDYYYCEFVENSIASYTHDYQFSRVDKSEISFDDNGNAIGCTHDHANAGYETTDIDGDGVIDSDVLKEDKTAVYLPFHQLFTGYSWGVSSIGLEELEGIKNITVTVGKEESVKKFETKFAGDFLYRVGNQNTVSLDSLFAAKDGVTINSSGVYVSIDKVDENSNVSGTFTANTTDWTKGTIQFSGTGVVNVTIQDYNFCTPTELYLEVVDATNATSSTNAKSCNVVLLQDCGFSSLEVSGGYTLYGNGFTMTCGSDSAALDMGYSFVTLNNGTLDNVQIVCPNFDYAVLYKSNMTESGNRSETTDKTRYFNVKSGVMAFGNSQILNSRISGGRAALNVSGGNVVVDNSRIELGAVASILVGSANSLTLKNVTLVQKPTASTHDSNKILMGFSVLSVCDTNGDATPITLEGKIVQNAWVDENDKQYVPSAGESIISTVLAKTEYLHDIDGDGTNESLNLGFAYMPESSTSKVNTTTITDNRTNKDTVPYDYAEVSILNGKTYVYSYKNTNGTEDSIKTESEYAPNKYGDIITVTYSDTADGLTTGKSYGTDGWVYELNVDLDKLSGYALDFSKLSMTVNGASVTNYKVNDSAKPTSPVAVIAGGTTYTLTATVDGKEHTAIFKVIGTETTKESPSLVASNYTAALLVGEAGSTLSKDTWHGAAPVLDGVQIKYWSVAEKQYKTIELSDYTPTKAGKQNETNTTWTYIPANGDFTLTITGGQVHSSNNVSAIPVVFNDKLYFVAASSNGLVNYGNSARTIPVTYSFKDNNGGTELKFSHTWSIECSDGATAYDYSDFMNGTSKEFTIKKSNGNSCVTPDTLVTLADGSQKEIQYVTYEDQLLVWNFEKGEYTVMPSSIVMNHGYDNYQVLTLNFEDGTTVNTINGHGFYDKGERKFVILGEDNVEDYIGHEFVKEAGKNATTTKLVSYSVAEEYTESWSILTAEHYNCVLEGMLTLTPAEVEGSPSYLMPYEINDNMKYNPLKKALDILKYGLYTYEDFEDYMTYEQFEALGLKNFKVSVGKGYISWDEILELVNIHIN